MAFGTMWPTTRDVQEKADNLSEQMCNLQIIGGVMRNTGMKSELGSKALPEETSLH